MAFYDKAETFSILSQALKFCRQVQVYLVDNYDRIYPHPDCVEEWDDEDEDEVEERWFTLKLKTMDDVEKCNGWLLQVAGVPPEQESHYMSLISILMYHCFRFRQNFSHGVDHRCDVLLAALDKLRNQKTKSKEEKDDMFNLIYLCKQIPRCNEILAAKHRFDFPMQKYSLACIEEVVEAANAYDNFHKTRAVRLIQKKFRRYLQKRSNAAMFIQKKWRQVISDPSCKPCVRAS
jgi:hypothetical protein